MKSYGKILALGEPRLSRLFEGPVEITEKLDGSQFRFGCFDGVLRVASKGKEMLVDAPEQMFSKAVDHVKGLHAENRLIDGLTYFAEYLMRPKHNVLAYSCPPTNTLCLWGVRDGDSFAGHERLREFADTLDIDCIPLLHDGVVYSPEDIHVMLEKQSYLGGAMIEGVVVKNYAHSLFWHDKEYPVLAGKIVSEKFKEKHKSTWKKDHTARGGFETFAASFCAEARWHKAVQHMRESGEIEVSPRDIGRLVKGIQADVADEEKENIKEELWRIFSKDILRQSIKGFPEWYKAQLLEGAFGQ